MEEGLACSNPAALTRIPSRLHVPWNCSTSDAMCGASISSATRDGALGRLITDGSPPDASSTANEEDVPDLADGDGVVTRTPSSSTASSSVSEDMRGLTHARGRHPFRSEVLRRTLTCWHPP